MIGDSMRNILFVILGLILVAAIYVTLPPVLGLLNVPVTEMEMQRQTTAALRAEALRQAEHTHQLAELHGKLDALAKIESSDVVAIIDLVARAGGTSGSSGRAFEPRPGIGGDFDPNTASLHDIVKSKDDRGNLIFITTYVDAKGRTLESQRSPEEMSRDDMVAWQVFELARKNQNLRLLVDSVRQMAEPPPHGEPPQIAEPSQDTVEPSE